MSAGTWMALAWLAVASGFLRWLYRQAPPDVPKNVDILRLGRRWTYVIKDSHSMRANVNGYWTRAAAIRAARAELERLEKRIET